nr:MAG TPA: hypothetical protein [Caudoviricetes sp.]
MTRRLHTLQRIRKNIVQTQWIAMSLQIFRPMVSL